MTKKYGFGEIFVQQEQSQILHNGVSVIVCLQKPIRFVLVILVNMVNLVFLVILVILVFLVEGELVKLIRSHKVFGLCGVKQRLGCFAIPHICHISPHTQFLAKIFRCGGI